MGRRLGQHFLKGTWAARALASAAGITLKDTVLEIGPGKGALTRELLKTGASVVARETWSQKRRVCRCGKHSVLHNRGDHPTVPYGSDKTTHYGTPCTKGGCAENNFKT